MNKQELISRTMENAYGAKEDIRKADYEAIVNAVFTSIEQALIEGDRVQLQGFGTFEIRDRAARKGVNPRNPKEILEIPACKAPAFKASKVLKEKVNA